MPGEAVSAIAPKKTSALEERLRVDDHNRLLHALGVGYVLGAAFFSYVLTVHIIIPNDGPSDPPRPPRDDRGFTFIDPHLRHAHALPHHPPHANPHHEAAPPPLVRHPGETAGILRQRVIGSRSHRNDYAASELVDRFLHNVDQDKIDHASLLSRTEDTRIASARKGIVRDTFNPEYNYAGKPDGTALIPDAPPAAAEPIRSTPIGHPDLASGSAITMASEGRLRSSESIMATIRSHAPGLRHLYNNFLKLRPGLSGKVTVRFAVSPRGDVVDAALVGSTMNLSEFEAGVLRSVSAWRFEPVKSAGNDIVTVPFTFSE